MNELSENCTGKTLISLILKLLVSEPQEAGSLVFEIKIYIHILFVYIFMFNFICI